MPTFKPVSVFSGFVLCGCALPSANIQSPEQGSGSAGRAKGGKAGKQAGKRGDRRRPRIVEARLLSPTHLRVQFSEPLASVEGVDPNDFRLSLGMAYAYKQYAYAYYYDLGEYVDSEGGLMNLVGLDGSGEFVDLQLGGPFPIEYCQEIAMETAQMQAEPGISAKGGIFLHYSPGEVPVSDPAGNDLAAIGAEWVLRRRRGGEEAYQMYFEGPRARKATRDLIPVACGAELPEGPR